MAQELQDITEAFKEAQFATAGNVEALGRALRNGKLCVPLQTTKGVQNRTEYIVREGAALPAHFLTFGDGKVASVLFSDQETAQMAAKQLNWTTDKKPLRCIQAPALMALNWALQVMKAKELEMLVVNPLHEASLHLNRKDIESLMNQTARQLSFYSNHHTMESAFALNDLGGFKDLFAGKLSSAESINLIGSELWPLIAALSAEAKADLKIVISKKEGTTEVKASRPLPAAMQKKIEKAVAERSQGVDNLEVTFDFAVSELAGEVGAPGWQPPSAAPTDYRETSGTKPSVVDASEAKPRENAKRYGYIPLEPEE